MILCGEPSPAGRLIEEMRQNGIRNESILAVMARIPREKFVIAALQANAYENSALPIGCGQTISQPLVVARMTEALSLDRRMKVLEVGTGSGYQAAVLSRLCRRVYSIERHAALLRSVERRLHGLGIYNVVIRHGDGRKGWKEQAPFQRIIVTAASPDIPPGLLEQLAMGGIMVLPVGDADAPIQDLLRITRRQGGINIERLAPVRFVPLVEGVVA